MNDALRATYEFLRGQYARQLGTLLAQSVTSAEQPDGKPTWHWQNVDLQYVSSEEEASGGVVLDPDIGICAFIQTYSRDADVRAQLARVLRIRSELLPGQASTTDDVDTRGEWRVVLYWLVEKADFTTWIDQVAEIRQETAHFEEVPVDAIMNNGGSWSSACEAHGFPRLLLYTRGVLAKSKMDEALAWASAESIVQSKLRGIPQRVSGAGAGRRARQLMEQLESVSVATTFPKADLPAKPDELYRISIENFRNLQKLSLNLRPEDQLVTSNVIQGPNGSGKSSIFEALMLAVGSVSGRYIEYLKDPNEPTQGKPRRYVGQYLTSLRSPALTPRVTLNEDSPVSVQAVDPERAPARHDALSGTFLCQTSTDNLLNKHADELGAQIAGSYSGTANSAVDWVDRQQAAAEAERAQFNREWGIRQNVTRVETARERIVDVVLAKVLPLPMPVQEWAREAPTGVPDTNIRTLLREWQTIASRQSEQFRELSRSTSKPELTSKIEDFITPRDRVLYAIAQEILRIGAGRSDLTQGIIRDIAKWGEWLAGRTLTAPSADTDEITKLRSEAGIASSLLGRIAIQGASLRERVAHLDGIAPFLNKHWLSLHPNTCPTCGTDLQSHNGLGSVILSVRRDTEQSLANLRTEYQQAKKELDEVNARLSAAGADEPPVSPERQVEILSHIRLRLGRGVDPKEISDEQVRTDIATCLTWIDQAPPPPFALGSEEHLKAQALELSNRAWDAFERFGAVSEAPEAWKQVQKAVVEALTEAVQEHLPQTVQALWWELARNMMPAPWQYPGEVEFQVAQRRGQPEARVVMRGETSPLAAHILNGAEIHNLAIAWFLTRYLIAGRFHYAFMVLDDPAQQMDQPTFRDLCRLLESLIRLHRYRSIPLTLIILLHQDERALDAARATDGTLHLLRWNKGTPALRRHMRMRSAAVRPRKPYRIMASV